MRYETFYGKLWKQGDSLVVTVPSNLVKYGGYNEGDKVKLLIKKEGEKDVLVNDNTENNRE